MIEVEVRANGVKLADIKIRNAGGTLEHGDYICHYTVSRGSALGAAVRTLHSFPRKRLNSLGLLRLALEALDEKELELERDFDPDAEAAVSTDMVRGFNPAFTALSSWLSGLHHHRPAIRGEQPEQHGSDGSRKEVREEDR
jgi:hypothetical protein